MVVAAMVVLMRFVTVPKVHHLCPILIRQIQPCLDAHTWRLCTTTVCAFRPGLVAFAITAPRVRNSELCPTLCTFDALSFLQLPSIPRYYILSTLPQPQQSRALLLQLQPQRQFLARSLRKRQSRSTPARDLRRQTNRGRLTFMGERQRLAIGGQDSLGLGGVGGAKRSEERDGPDMEKQLGIKVEN